MSALDLMTAEAKAELKQSLKFIKTCEYKGTAVKVELEAQLDRDYDEDESETCADCGGDGYFYCDDCDDGHVECDVCEGTDEVENDEGLTVFCNDCEEEGFNWCTACGGDSRIDCNNCAGSGYIENDGNSDWGDNSCKDFMLENVPEEARDALIFSRFYNDGSVDSEFTFTLPIDKAELAVHFIEAFKKLAGAIGNRLDTDGAGMHIAILNSPDGNYPSGNSIDNGRKGQNFVRALEPLLPALYFLASPDHKSRGLRYRPPQVNLFDKYACISGSHGVFEYRIFETCYDKPLAFIDYMIVVANTLKFYTEEAIDTSLKIGPLGIKDGQGIDRFYYTSKHIEALDKGLKLLKPAYKTITQLKIERNFRTDKRSLQRQEKKRHAEWLAEFDRVKERRKFERNRVKYVFMAEAWGELQQGLELNEGVSQEQFIRDYVDRRIRNYQQNGNQLTGTARQYIRERMQQYLTQDVRYSITA